MQDTFNERAVLHFIQLAKKKFEKGSFFKLYKFVLSQLREPSEDMTSVDPAVAFCMEIFEHVLTKEVKCPRCDSQYQFRHFVPENGGHCMEIYCESCGDLFEYSEENASENYLNLKVMSKIASYNRRGKGLKIKAYRGDYSKTAELVWRVEHDVPESWINTNTVRRVDEIEAHWHQAKKEIQKRNRLAKNVAGY